MACIKYIILKEIGLTLSVLVFFGVYAGNDRGYRNQNRKVRYTKKVPDTMQTVLINLSNIRTEQRALSSSVIGCIKRFNSNTVNTLTVVTNIGTVKRKQLWGI